jgi:hypothetical protein
MTPKEKAIELIIKYLDIENYKNFNLDLFCDECGINEQSAKYCALIAVDLRLDGYFLFTSIEYGEDSLEYWQEVKQEIENI